MTMKETAQTEFIPEISSHENLISSLSEFGITQNQARVYLYLSKNTPKSAPEISKSLKIPRTETYHLLNGLQSKGITIATFGKPCKFQAIPFEKSVLILVSNERTRVDELESQTNNLISLWKTLPESGNQTDNTPENRFQILQGKISIVGKLNQMVSSAKNNIQILGSEKDFKKFYHTEFFKQLQKIDSSVKILMASKENSPYLFPGFPLESTKIIHDHLDDNLWFLIKDGKEVFFFIQNNESSEMLAVWTDSKTMLNSLMLLLDMIWKTAKLANTT